MSVRRRKRERGRIAIVAEILEMARDGVLKSNMKWRAGPSYLMLNEIPRAYDESQIAG